MKDSLQVTGGQRHGERFARYARRMRDEIKAIDRSQKQIAADLQMDQGHLSRILNAQESLGVHHLEVWDREIGPGLLDYVLAQREEVHVSEDPESIAAMLSLLARQQGASFSEILSALDDKVLEPNEARAILGGWIKVQHVVNAIVSHIERVAR